MVQHSLCDNILISIHALREEGDLQTEVDNLTAELFLSTPSARRATSRQSLCCWCSSYFYPRPPRGGRPKGASAPRAIFYFYPRPPRGGRHSSREGYWSTE